MLNIILVILLKGGHIMGKQLFRSYENKVIAGVCGGVAEYFEVDPTIVRIIWLLSIFAGVGIIAYIVCWIVMPERHGSYSSYSSNYSSPSSSGDSSVTRQTSVDKEKSKKILGIALIIIGALFMFDRFFKWFDMDIVIPIAIIAVGAYILLNNKRG